MTDLQGAATLFVGGERSADVLGNGAERPRDRHSRGIRRGNEIHGVTVRETRQPRHVLRPATPGASQAQHTPQREPQVAVGGDLCVRDAA